jgi:hypothetical protein
MFFPQKDAIARAPFCFGSCAKPTGSLREFQKRHAERGLKTAARQRRRKGILVY